MTDHNYGWGRLVPRIDDGTHYASRRDAGADAKRLKAEGLTSVRVVADPQGRGHVVEAYKANGWLMGALKVEG